ncbi:hypothetical protein FQP90_19975 [Paenarthrobacter nitroguajacolicus]|uniref:DUF308 domain-containing protein n=1 Tax=Paenarthrobacter nitroguajacolicus TaxID=211146 RepID=A0A558GQF0_PAENT|nr:hypothetical protein [Paenarthrobacter nitroguajacolicus]TVU59098.1 hypothetical protein FQP90_19975 [Paenarthrobacter nitroguajacolicus]
MNRPDPNSADQSANKDDDAVWQDLVARLEATESSTAGDVPASDPAGPDAPKAPNAPRESGKTFRDFDPLGLSTPAAEPADDAAAVPAVSEARGRPLGPRDFEVDDAEDAFVPEDPPSLVGTEPLIMLAWVGAVGGPIALLFTAMFWRSAPLAAILGIVAAFVASVVYLIMRLPQEKNEDDDGARI